MNIASAFILGTKIKEVEVPDTPWTKIATYPNTTGNYILKSGMAYNGSIYVTAGNTEWVPRYSTADIVVKRFNGNSWSTAATLTTPASEYSEWGLTRGSMLYCKHGGKLYLAHSHYGDYGAGGPACGWVFDGTTWQVWSLPVGGINQIIEKDGKMYLFQVGRRGAWNVSYWWNVYEYNDSDGSATLLASNVADHICDGSQEGLPQIVLLNNELHAVTTYNICRHFIINDDWSTTSLNDVPYRLGSIIVYKNKIHGFGNGGNWSPYAGNHLVWDSVNDVWEASDDHPYPNSVVGYSNYSDTLPIIYKNKMTLLGGRFSEYSVTYDEFYRYNR